MWVGQDLHVAAESLVLAGIPHSEAFREVSAYFGRQKNKLIVLLTLQTNAILMVDAPTSSGSFSDDIAWRLSTMFIDLPSCIRVPIGFHWDN